MQEYKHYGALNRHEEGLLETENKTFRMLYVIGIILVVTSHTSGGGVKLLTDWFHENSFHMQLFFFASGYFYKTANEQQAAKYIIKKMCHLVVPCLIINFLYGLFTLALSYKGFEIGGSISLYNVLISPFVFGSAFRFNSPDWFIAQLFIVEIVNVCIGKLFRLKWKYREHLICIGYVILGIFSVILSQDTELNTFHRLICRTVFCLSWYGIGRMYRLVFEKHDHANNFVYFSVIFTVQLILLLANNGNVQGSVVRFSFGELNVWSIYLCALTGIFFWLRICKLIAPYVLENKWIAYLSKHTFSVVENQYLGFFLINAFLYVLQSKGNVFIDFNVDNFKTMHNYIFKLNNNTNFPIVYLAAGIVVPLLLSKLFDKAQQVWRKYGKGNRAKF